MITIKITTPNDFPIIRQLPTNDPIFDNLNFVINKDIKECDYWIIYDNLRKPETVLCPLRNTILFTGEPSTVRVYNHSFINQFATLITTQKHLTHPYKIYSQTCLPWLVGITSGKDHHKFSDANYWTYSNFKLNTYQNKNKLISIITSNKTLSRGHKQRLDFIYKLKSELGDQLEIFGSGFKSIPDKMDAMQDFKYSLVIENSQHKNYWTEKIADAFLCNCYPIYFGCSNIYDYFDQNSLSTIDISKPQQAINTIQEAIQNEYYEKNKSKILESKNKILTDYNFFHFIKNLIQAPIEKEKQLITLLPERNNVFDKIRTKIYRII